MGASPRCIRATTLSLGAYPIATLLPERHPTMPDSLPAVLGFGVLFLIVGTLGGAQLGPPAAVILLSASAVLLAFGGVTALSTQRRRAAPGAQTPVDGPTPPRS